MGEGVRGDLREELAAGLKGDERRARLALIDELRAQGYSDDALREAHHQDRLALLPLDRVLSSDDSRGLRTLADIARTHGIDVEHLIASRRALGLTVDTEAAIYGDGVELHAARLRETEAFGIPFDLVLDLNRAIGRSMAGIAAAGRDTVARMLAGTEGLDEHARANGLAWVAERLTPMLREVIFYAYEEHVREMIRNDRADALALAPGVVDTREVAIAFADLVGFTSLGYQLAPGDLSAVAERLEELATQSLRPRVSLIKTLGDEVMLASEDPGALAQSVLALVAAADVEADGYFPKLRAGAAAGPAVRRAADWYGAPVNLASRLTALGEPGTLLADQAFAAAAGDAAAWEPAGDREVRGVGRAVATFRALPPA